MDPIPTQPLSAVQVLSKKVMLTFPWYNTVSPMTAFSVAQLCDKRRTASMICHGDAFVVHTRNTCADMFLSTDLEYMLTIDSDMIVPFGNAAWFNANTGFSFPEKFAGMNLLDRLLSHGKSLVGALYFQRSPNGKPVFNEGAANKVSEADARNTPRDELRPTKWVGTGAMLIHRKVFEDIEKKFPRLARGPSKRGGNWFTSSENTAMDAIARAMTLFSSGPLTGEVAARAQTILASVEADARNNSGLGMGEDVIFCNRAAQAGHTPYVDFGCVCGHVGYKVYGP